MRPDFSKIDYRGTAGREPEPARKESSWLAPEGIPVKPWYTARDTADLEHLDYAAGLPPYLRGNS